MFFIGCHLSASKGYANMAREAISLGANTFQFFTRNPRGFSAKEPDEKDISEFLTAVRENGFGKVVAHAPYTLNPASADERVRDLAFRIMEDDMKRMEMIPGNLYNFHPGSHVGQGAEKGIELTSELLNRILTPDQTTTVLLETMAGKGSELGRNFEELAAIIEKTELKDKIGVCLDTCHVFDGGYDIVSDIEGVISEFDKIIGINRLKAVHVNDSKNPFKSHKDRHELIGKGNIGLSAFENIINFPKLTGLPFILETPNDLAGYKEEISLLKSLYKGE